MKFWSLVFITLLLLTFFPLRSGSLPTKKANSLCKNLKPILCAYFLGDKSMLPKKVIKIHREMNLLHLMTPSGLHLGSLLLIVLFLCKVPQFFGRVSWHSEKVLYGALILLGVSTFTLQGIDSFKRMILFALIRKFPFKTFTKKSAFLLTFLISAFFGQLQENPLSFCFSFLFLGILLFSSNRFLMLISLFLSQAFISEWMGKPFSILTSLIGLLLSSIAPFLFISFLPEIIFPILPLSDLWVMTLTVLHKTFRTLLPFFFLISVPIHYHFGRPRLFKLAIFFTLLLTPKIVTPNLKGNSFNAPPPSNYIKRKQLKDKILFIYHNDMRCYAKLLGDHWRTYCYK